MSDELPTNLDLRWIGHKLLSVQAEQATLRAMIEPIPARLSALESRFNALEARISGIESTLHAITVSLQHLNEMLIEWRRGP